MEKFHISWHDILSDLGIKMLFDLCVLIGKNVDMLYVRLMIFFVCNVFYMMKVYFTKCPEKIYNKYFTFFHQCGYCCQFVEFNVYSTIKRSNVYVWCVKGKLSLLMKRRLDTLNWFPFLTMIFLTLQLINDPVLDQHFHYSFYYYEFKPFE